MKTTTHVASSFAFLVALIFIISPPAHAQTLIIIRHAEAFGVAKDAKLKPEGEKRVESLPVSLKKHNLTVTKIFLSECLRSQATAGEVLRKDVKILVNERTRYNADPGDMAKYLTDEITKKEDVGLLVHHSTTIPSLLRNLCNGKLLDKIDLEKDMKTNDSIYVLTRIDGGWKMTDHWIY